MKGRKASAVTLTATVLLLVAAGAVAVASMRHYHRAVAQAAAEQGSSGAGGNEASSSASRTPVSAGSVSSSPPVVPKVVTASLPKTTAGYLGVYEGSDLSTAQYSQVEEFAAAVGRQPNIDLYYSSWGEPFSVPLAQTAFKYGASLLVDLDPTSASLADIAAGQDDDFLNSYAESVKVFGHPVLISFGHEMNGTWYPWGWTNSSPADFVAAWRHVVDVFRADGADNVTWVWTVNSVSVGEGPIADYWPGSNYVNWVGIDAYYYDAGSTFNGVFGPTVAAVRQVTDKPILITETAIGQVAGQAANIPGLFAGVASDGLLGFVWFDQNQTGDIYHQEWRLEGHPAALAAFRAAMATYFK